ncbi:MAG: T9SS type A sorting domain-containing protein [Saprospiraceae bacterium]|nr:T9SS type A sorting domain-containing protein [Saprospiraceae bacterium]
MLYSQSLSLLYEYSPNGLVTSKVLDIDSIAFSIVGPQSVCPETEISLQTSNSQNGEWSTGQYDDQIDVLILSDTVFSVVLENSFGCEFKSEIIIGVLPKPVQPIIEQQGNKLIVTNVDGEFRWYKNGALYLTGPNAIIPIEKGEYTVVVIGENGCLSILSAPIIYKLTSTSDSFEGRIHVHPNPAVDKLYIQNESDDDVTEIMFIDALNRITYVVKGDKSNTIDISHLAAGSYNMVLHLSNNMTISELLIKL